MAEGGMAEVCSFTLSCRKHLPDVQQHLDTALCWEEAAALSVPGGAPWLTMGLGPACAGSLIGKEALPGRAVKC